MSYDQRLADAERERDRLRAEVERLRGPDDTGDDSLSNVRRLRAELAAAQKAIRKGSEDALYMRDGLLKQLAAAKADTERIDWLENQGQLIARQYRDGWHFDASNGAWVCVNATTLRDAIDAARAGTANKAQP